MKKYIIFFSSVLFWVVLVLPLSAPPQEEDRLSPDSQDGKEFSKADQPEQPLSKAEQEGRKLAEKQQQDPSLTPDDTTKKTLAPYKEEIKKLSPVMQALQKLVTAEQYQVRLMSSQESIKLVPPNHEHEEQLRRLIINGYYQTALSELSRPLLSREKQREQLGSIVINFYEAYQQAGITIHLNDRTNRCVESLINLSKFYIDDLQKHAEYVAKQLREKKDYKKPEQQMARVTEVYDGAMQRMAERYFAQEKEDFLQYYKRPRNITVLGIYNKLLKHLVHKNNFSDAVVKEAESYVAQCDSSWDPTVVIVGYQTSTNVHDAFNTTMAQIYEGRAKELLGTVNFKTGTRAGINLAFDKANELFIKASERYNKAHDVAHYFSAIEQGERANIKKSSYELAWQDRTNAEQLAKSEKFGNQKKAVALFNNAFERFQKAGDYFNADRMQMKYNRLQADVSVKQGRRELDDYKEAADEYVSTKNIGSKNKILAIQTGVEQPEKEERFGKAADHYRTAIEFYLKAGFSIAHHADDSTEDVNVKALTDAYSLLMTVTEINAFRMQADKQAQELTEEGLSLAEQLYQNARLSCVRADEIFFSDPNVLHNMPLCPAFIAQDTSINYQYVLNHYVADYYRALCQPLIESKEEASARLALLYYSAAASHGVDMSGDIQEIQELVGVIDAARSAKEQAEQLSKKTRNWKPLDPAMTAYNSVANSAWKKAISMYQAAITANIQGAQDETLHVLKTYADQFKQHVPEKYFPRVGAIMIYAQLKEAYARQGDKERAETLQRSIDDFVREIRTNIAHSMSPDIIDNLVSQKLFQQALEKQQRLVFYYQQKYPQTSESILGVPNDEIKKAVIKEMDIYRAWGQDDLRKKNFHDAFTHLYMARTGYKKQGQDERKLPHDEHGNTFRQNYFRARTLATAMQVYDNIQIQGTVSVEDRFTVPRNYFLKQVQQAIPDDVSISGNPYNVVTQTYIANKLSDEGISYKDAIGTGSLTDKQKKRVTVIKKEAEAYTKSLRDNPLYSAVVIREGVQSLLEEKNKQIPAIAAPYSTAPTALGYYMAALTLIRPGRELVSFSGKKYVPGQDDDWAWEIGKDIAFAFLSDVAVYKKNIPDLRVKTERTFESFQSLNEIYAQIYTRYVQAYEFFNGKEHEAAFYGESRFAKDAAFMNKIMAHMWQQAAAQTKQFIIGDPGTKLFASAVDETFKNNMSARQHYIEWYKTKRIASVYSMPEANERLLVSAQTFEEAGDACMKTSTFYSYAAPYYSTAVTTYDTLASNGILSMSDPTTRTMINTRSKKDALTVKLYESYFKMAAAKMLEFNVLKKSNNIIDGLSMGALIDKYNKFISGQDLNMSKAQLKEYSRIEGLELDALMYLLYAKGKYTSLILSSRRDAAIDKAKKDVDAYITGKGISTTKINDNSTFQALVLDGYQTFMKKPTFSSRYADISRWSSKMYLSFAQTYINIYLPGMSLTSQWIELNSRMQARTRQLTAGVAVAA